jgi:hypothetical protein
LGAGFCVFCFVDFAAATLERWMTAAAAVQRTEAFDAAVSRPAAMRDLLAGLAYSPMERNSELRRF